MFWRKNSFGTYQLSFKPIMFMSERKTRKGLLKRLGKGYPVSVDTLMKKIKEDRFLILFVNSKTATSFLDTFSGSNYTECQDLSDHHYYVERADGENMSVKQYCLKLLLERHRPGG